MCPRSNFFADHKAPGPESALLPRYADRESRIRTDNPRVACGAWTACSPRHGGPHLQSSVIIHHQAVVVILQQEGAPFFASS